MRKVRKCLVPMLACLLLLSLLAGCSAGSDSVENRYEMAVEATSAEYDLGSSEYNSESSASLPENRKLIRTVNISAETKGLDILLDRLDARVAELGGYTESRSIYHGSTRSGTGRRNASLTLRIPVAQADAFLETVESDSNVISINEDLDDVTLSYVATESRMNALQAEEERLLELMAMASNITELLEIESRLTDVRSELESVTSQLRVYDNQVDYATIYLSVSEVQELTPVVEKTVWQRMGQGFMNCLKGIGTFFVELAVILVSGLPVLVLLGILIFLVVVLARRNAKKRKFRQPPPAYYQPPNPPAEE